MFVRVNTDARQAGDIAAVMASGAFGFVVPKAHDPQALDAFELPMFALIETPGGVLDARAVALIVDGDRVVGVVVRIDNQDRFVRAAKGVVLGTGGFVFNDAMRAKYCADSFRVNSPIGDKDDGIGIGRAHDRER